MLIILPPFCFVKLNEKRNDTLLSARWHVGTSTGMLLIKQLKESRRSLIQTMGGRTCRTLEPLMIILTIPGYQIRPGLDGAGV